MSLRARGAWMWRLGAVLACLWVTAAGARAAAPEAGTQQYRLGSQAYLDADFAKALRHLDEAAALAKDPALLAQIHLKRGLCFAALRATARMEQAFTLALENDPDVQLSRSEVLPEVVDRLDALRRQLRGTLEVRVEPAPARLSLDGEDLGEAPFQGRVAMGLHHLVARGPGGAQAEQDVRVAANQSQSVVIVMAHPEPASAVARPMDTPALRRQDAVPWLYASLELRGNVSLMGNLSPQAEVLISGALWQAGAALTWASAPAVQLKAGASTPVFGRRFALYANLQGVVFLRTPRLIGPGLAVGVTAELLPWLQAVADLSAWRLTSASTRSELSALVGLGLRFRIPIAFKGAG